MSDYNDGIVKKTKLSGYIKENIDDSMFDKLIKIFKNDIDIYIYDDDVYYSDFVDEDVFNTGYFHGFFDNDVIWKSEAEEYVLGIDDRDTLIRRVKKNIRSYEYIPNKYKKDVSFNLEVIDGYEILKYFSDEMKTNKEILYKVLEKLKDVDGIIYDECSVDDLIKRIIPHFRMHPFYYFSEELIGDLIDF